MEGKENAKRKNEEEKENAKRKKKEGAKLRQEEKKRENEKKKETKAKKPMPKKTQAKENVKLHPEDENSVPSTSLVKATAETKEKKKDLKSKKPIPKKRLIVEESESGSSAQDRMSGSSDPSLEEEDKIPCGDCGKLFGQDFKGESWIKCSNCQMWFHNRCQSKPEKWYDVKFKCDECSPLAP